MRRFLRVLTFSSLLLLIPISLSAEEHAADTKDTYDVLLHSRSLADQREAVKVIMDNPEKYVTRIQQSLRDYPRLLRTDPLAAKRSIYISALLRDPSFPGILVKSLDNADVLGECEYACPVVFALTVQACFGGWHPPSNMDSGLTTVHDLQFGIEHMSQISLKVEPIENVVRGPGVEKYQKKIEGKSEEQLIQLAGPITTSLETRMFAAFRLETLVSGSKNRIELYMLALNDFQDGSSEYRGAVYQSIYRAELAKARGK